MKHFKSLMDVTVLSLATMLLTGACDETKTISPSQLDGVWTGGKVPGQSGDLLMTFMFDPDETDSLKGVFGIWYEGQWTDTDEDDTEFTVNFRVSDKGTYELNGNDITLHYQPDSTGVQIDPDDVLKHARNVAAKDPKVNVEEKAEEFGQFFTSFIGDTFKEMFSGRNTKQENEHTLAIVGDKLTVTTGDVKTLTFTRLDTSDAEE